MDQSLPSKLEQPHPSDEAPDVEVVQLNDGRLVAVLTASTGPIPDADQLAAYNGVVAGSAEKIIAEFLLEGAASRARDDKLTDAHIASRTRAQYLAFTLAMGFILVAALAVVMNQPWIAGLFGAVGAAGIILGILKDGGIALPSPPFSQARGSSSHEREPSREERVEKRSWCLRSRRATRRAAAIMRPSGRAGFGDRLRRAGLA